MKNSELRARAKALALHIIAVCDEIDARKGRGVLVNQIVRSATSIGANIHEANYAVSKAYLFDFDGTLVDSMPTFAAAMTRILDEYNIKYDIGFVKVVTPLGYRGAASVLTC